MRGARWGPLEKALSVLAGLSEEEVKSTPGSTHRRWATYPLPVSISFVASLAETSLRAALESWFGEVGMFAESVDSPCCRSVE